MPAAAQKRKLSSFQIIILGFAGFILIGTLLLMLPVSAKSGLWTSPECALFTATSAVCVTGLVMQDTASYWSVFGQVVILILIQVGGLGVVTVAAFIESAAGKRLTLRERDLVENSISAFQVGGLAKMTRFIFAFAFTVELAGAILLMPVFFLDFGVSGIWMAFFHSISAFCNAGFDLMGTHSGAYSSLTYYSGNYAVIVPVCLLIVAGGIGFLTWYDIVVQKKSFKKYRLQSKVVIVTTAALILIPTILYFFSEFSGASFWDRFGLSLFQAVTPRTAGFNSADLTKMTGAGLGLMIMLMLIGGSPGSTAGGMKTTTLTVLLANAVSVFRRRKETQLFSRRVEDNVIRNACALLMVYLFLTLAAGGAISLLEGLPLSKCVFETASAAGTVGLTLGITPSLGLVSHLILIGLMFFGRVGGLTIIFAAISGGGPELSKHPVEKIIVG